MRRLIRWRRALFSRLSNGWLLYPATVVGGRRAVLVPLGALLLLMALVTTTARVMPASPLHLGAEDCTQPCWEGMQLGEISRADTLALIEARGLAQPGSIVDRTPENFVTSATLRWQTRQTPKYDVYMRFVSDRLIQLSLYPKSPVVLEDIFGAFGLPSHARLCRTSRYYPANVHATLFFFDGALEVQATRALESQATPAPGSTGMLSHLSTTAVDWALSPTMPVTSITYRAAVLEITNIGPVGAVAWPGYLPLRDLPLCN